MCSISVFSVQSLILWVKINFNFKALLIATGRFSYETAAAASRSDCMSNSLIWISSVLFRRMEYTVISNVYFLCPFFVLDVYQWRYWLAEQQQLFRLVWAGNVPPFHSAVFTWADINWVNAIDFGHLPFSKGEVSGKRKRRQHLGAAKRRRKKCVWER